MGRRDLSGTIPCGLVCQCLDWRLRWQGSPDCLPSYSRQVVSRCIGKLAKHEPSRARQQAEFLCGDCLQVPALTPFPNFSQWRWWPTSINQINPFFPKLLLVRVFYHSSWDKMWNVGVSSFGTLGQATPSVMPCQAWQPAFFWSVGQKKHALKFPWLDICSEWQEKQLITTENPKNTVSSYSCLQVNPKHEDETCE